MTFPFESGVYSVSPGLRPLEPPVLRFDQLERYRAEKQAAAAMRPVCLEHQLPAETRRAAIARLRALIECECPDFQPVPPDDLTALPFLLEEDVAIIQTEGHREWLAFGHVCLPSSWRLEDKIGRPFLEVHQPVPGFPAQGATNLVRSLTTKGPYERFAWGLTNEDRLDQTAPVHADVLPPPAPLFVRVERQTIHPLPGCGAWLFTIHPANTPVEELRPEQRAALAAALTSMTPEQAVYKGLGTTRAEVTAALLASAHASHPQAS